jgi:predicted SnoaL-like aldol condensation-catalyzing enzyme
MLPATRLPAALLAALFAGAAAAQLPVEAHRNQAELLPSPDAALAANKRLAFDFWREVVQARHVEKIADYVAADFVEHDAGGAGGRDAFRATVGAGAPLPVKGTIDDLVSIVAERDLVVLAFRRELPDLEHEGQTYTTTGFEMLRIAGGRIAERWSFTPNE